MSWRSFFMRCVLTVTVVCGLLYWSETVIPMGALLIFLLVVSIGLTWAIINLLKDDDTLANLFDD